MVQYNKKEKKKNVNRAKKLFQGRFPPGPDISCPSIFNPTIQIDHQMYKRLVHWNPTSVSCHRRSHLPSSDLRRHRPSRLLPPAAFVRMPDDPAAATAATPRVRQWPLCARGAL